MKTENLVDLLARQAGPAPRRLVQTRLIWAVLAGAAISLLSAWLYQGLHPEFAQLSRAELAIKLGYLLAMLMASGRLAAALARPGAPFLYRELTVLGVLVLMLLSACLLNAELPFRLWPVQIFGQSWLTCPWVVAGLSLPPLVCLIWAMRGLAPTRPRLSGFAAGLMAGGVGALVYALYCPEPSALFVLVWYTLGMLAPAVLGSLIGPRCLRW